MPEVLVIADDGFTTWREGVAREDFETEHFRACLAERIGWAVEDAATRERGPLIGDSDPARN